MLTTEQLNDKIVNIYNSTKNGDMPIQMAVGRIHSLLRTAGNPKSEEALELWHYNFDISTRTGFIKKNKKDLKTLPKKEYEFEHNELKVPSDIAKENTKKVIEGTKQSIKDAEKLDASWVQIEAHQFYAKPVPADYHCLNTLMHNLGLPYDKH